LIAGACWSVPADAAFPGRNGDIAYVGYAGGRASSDVFTYDPTSGESVRLTRGPADVNDPAFSPDGERIVYGRERRNGDPSDLWAMDADGSHRVQLTSTPRDDLDPTFSADGLKVAYTVREKTFVIRADGRGKPVLLSRELPDQLGFEPSFSPDGTKVAISGRGASATSTS
jgi:Tol biopolymer transport system component